MPLFLPDQQHAHRLRQAFVEQIEGGFGLLIGEPVADQRLDSNLPRLHQFDSPRQQDFARVLVEVTAQQPPPLHPAGVQGQRLTVIKADQVQRAPDAYHLLRLRKRTHTWLAADTFEDDICASSLGQLHHPLHRIRIRHVDGFVRAEIEGLSTAFGNGINDDQSLTKMLAGRLQDHIADQPLPHNDDRMPGPDSRRVRPSDAAFGKRQKSGLFEGDVVGQRPDAGAFLPDNRLNDILSMGGRGHDAVTGLKAAGGLAAHRVNHPGQRVAHHGRIDRLFVHIAPQNLRPAADQADLAPHPHILRPDRGHGHLFQNDISESFRLGYA